MPKLIVGLHDIAARLHLVCASNGAQITHLEVGFFNSCGLSGHIKRACVTSPPSWRASFCHGQPHRVELVGFLPCHYSIKNNLQLVSDFNMAFSLGLSLLNSLTATHDTFKVEHSLELTLAEAT
ncbi:hypothetical protein Q8O96_29485 [Pseudomonas sp. LPH60]|uniref:hypothetical protein n=1 Tax=Pseudomonas sp. LPH60 TaxID=3065906 RepID=UPI00273B0F77|nr:hypothetical protein [Pseudomonas sp. LPH60]MDP4573214.1 hypothetical protein [Pseudomonas sp. LPH60]